MNTVYNPPASFGFVLALQFDCFKVFHLNHANQNQSQLFKMGILLIHCSQRALWESFFGLRSRCIPEIICLTSPSKPGSLEKLVGSNHITLYTKPLYLVCTINHHTLRENLSPLNMIQEIVWYPSVTLIQADLREVSPLEKNVNYKQVLFGACSTINAVML